MNENMIDTQSLDNDSQLTDGELNAASGGIIWGLVAGIVLWNVFMVEKEAK